MTWQLVAASTATITSRSGRVHVLTVWTCATLGDWASISIDDVPMVEVSGDAVNRLNTCLQALVTQLSQ